LKTEKSLRHALSAHALHSQYDSRELTAAARAKFLIKFVDQVDPKRVLSEAERLKRAEHALRAYMLKLALKSAKARRRRREEAS